VKPSNGGSKPDDNARLQQGEHLFDPEADAEEMPDGDSQPEGATGPRAIVTPWPTIEDGAFYGPLGEAARLIEPPCWCICWSPLAAPLAVVRDW
jgi:hypothetical protein